MLHAAAARALAALLGLAALIVLLPVIGTAATSQLIEFSGSAIVPGTFNFTKSAAWGGIYSYFPILLSNGKVLLIGAPEPNAPLSAWLYDPQADTLRAVDAPGQLRAISSATLLTDGSVLLLGNANDPGTERYNSATETFEPAGDLVIERVGYSATLLADGRVLVAGGRGGIRSAELYDPVTDTFSPTGDMHVQRSDHSAVRLADGRVLILGGLNDQARENVRSAELYDPATGTFSPTGDMSLPFFGLSAELLTDGGVFLMGYHNGGLSAQLYDPNTGAFTATELPRLLSPKLLRLADGQVLAVGEDYDDAARLGLGLALYDPARKRFLPLATSGLDGEKELIGYRPLALPNNRFLLFGAQRDFDYEGNPIAVPILVQAHEQLPTNTISGRLLVPGGWITGTGQVTASLSASASDVPVASALIGSPWRGPLSEPVPLTDGETVTVSLTIRGEERGAWLRLLVRDSLGREAAVARGRVDVDTRAPTLVFNQPAYRISPRFWLRWASYDLNGLSGYWLDVRAGDGPWRPLLANTMQTIVGYRGVPGQRYCFRLRAADNVGNHDPTGVSRCTTILADPPATLLLNGGARSSTTRTVRVGLANPALPLAGAYSWEYRINGSEWSAWSPQSSAERLVLPEGDEEIVVSLRLRDSEGTLSGVMSSTIRLDEAAGTASRLLLNEGATYTNAPTLALTIGAAEGAAAMQLSDRPDFAGAEWQPFDSRPSWTLRTAGAGSGPRTLYARVRNVDGAAGPTLSAAILYDPQAPAGAITRVRREGERVTLELSASDEAGGSGLGWMRVGLAGELEAAEWRPYAASAQLTLPTSAPGGQQVVAEFRDRAGNRSGTSCRTLADQPCPLLPQLYLPALRH